jgi:hypothetical protein
VRKKILKVISPRRRAVLQPGLEPGTKGRQMRGVAYACALVAAAPLLIAAGLAARAQAAPHAQQKPADAFYDTETKYMFGFLDGADIGNEGEKAFEYEGTGSFQKRGGRYTAFEHELEFEHVPTQNFAYELSAHLLSHAISGVEGLDDHNSTQFSGLSAKLRYLIVGRGPGSPIGLTVSAEPEWARVDDVDGTRTQSYSSEFRVVADTELIANRLYAALNLMYEPGTAKPADSGVWERTSDGGIGLGVTYRLTPTWAMGVAAEYHRAYDGVLFQTFDGEALFLGPTLQINFTPKVLLAAAFSAQVAGHAVDDSRALDLTNFEKYRANLKLEFEF